MLSVSGNIWEETKISKRVIEKVKNDLDFSEILSKLIISRNFNYQEIDTILNETQVSNPFSKLVFQIRFLNLVSQHVSTSLDIICKTDLNSGVGKHTYFKHKFERRF